MIVPATRGATSRDEFVVCPSAPSTLSELRSRMLQRAKVTEGSYAHRLIDDLYSAIFVRSLDLKLDYELYFAREYGSFETFLRRRTAFSPTVVAELAALVEVSAGMYHFQPSHAFLADSYGLEFLTRLLDDPPGGNLR